MVRNKRNSFSTNYILQAGGLTAPILIFHLIGLVYRIPLVNIIGTSGIGYYTTAWSLLFLLFLIFGYGPSLALSKLVNEKTRRREYMGAASLFKTAAVMTLAAGVILLAVLYFGGDHVVGALFYRSISHNALKTMLPAFLMLLLGGIILGYFSGLGNHGILPLYLGLFQLFNIPVGLFFAYRMYQAGVQSGLVFKNDELAGSMGAQGAARGAVAGALAALLLVLIIYGLSRQMLIRRISKGRNEMGDSYGRLAGQLAAAGLSLTAGCAVHHFLLVSDNILFSRVMRGISGSSLEISALWGEYSGKYLVIVGIPMFYSLWMASRSLYRFGRAVDGEDRGQMLSSARSTLHLTMVFAIPAALFLTLFAGPVVNLLFAGDNQIATKMVLTGSARVILMSLALAGAGILSLAKRRHELFLNTGVAFLVYLVTLLGLLLGGRLSVHGLVFGNLVFAAVASILNIRTIIGRLGYRIEMARTFFFPFLASGFMGGIAVLIYMLLMNLTDNNGIATLVALIIAVITYTIIILKVKCLDEFDLRLLPGGSKRIGFYRRLRLM